MAKLADLSRPVMRRAACLKADKRSGLFGEERQNLGALQPTPEYQLAGLAGPVDLKDVLGNIKADDEVGH